MALTPSASYSLTVRADKKVAPAVAREVVRAAQRGGLARRRRRAAHSR